MKVARVSTAQLVVAPIRLVLGVVLLAAAGGGGAALGAFAAGAFGLAFVVLQDPRRRLLTAREPPEPLPAGAVLETRARLAVATIFPSTVGVTVLAAVAVALGQEMLAALLAGALAGMGLAAAVGGGSLLARERRLGAVLLADRRTNRRYEAPREFVHSFTKR